MDNRVGFALAVVVFAVAGFASGRLERGHPETSDEIVSNGPAKLFQADKEEETAQTHNDPREPVQGPSPFAQQSLNDDVLDHTIFNCHFETGSGKLTADGLKRLDNLARRRSGPDLKPYLATARDVAYDSAAPEKLAVGRRELNATRAASIKKYLTASNAGRLVSYDVTVIEFLND
jgi:hypothetical protein